MKYYTVIVSLILSAILFTPQEVRADLGKAQEAYLLKDYEQAMQEYKKVDDPIAMYQVGYMYSHGEGVPQDGKEAEVWYRKAAEKGLAKAQYRMGMIYEHGNGVDQDLKEAERWYRRSAGQGFRPAKDALKKLEAIK